MRLETIDWLNDAPPASKKINRISEMKISYRKI